MYELERFVELMHAVFFSVTLLWNTFRYGEILEELHCSCPQKRILGFVSSVPGLSVLTNNGKYRQIYMRLLQYEICEHLRRGSRNFNFERHRDSRRSWKTFICVFLLLLIAETMYINPLNAELNPIRHLLARAGAHHFVHGSGIRVNRFLEQSASSEACSTSASQEISSILRLRIGI